LLFWPASSAEEFSRRRLAADDDDEVSSVTGRLLFRGEVCWSPAAGAEGGVLLLPVILLTGTEKGRMEIKSLKRKWVGVSRTCRCLVCVGSFEF
jgi:hypothetical protein